MNSAIESACAALALSACFVACARASQTAAVASPAPQAAVASPTQALELPGAPGPLSLDYLFYERAPARVWVPTGGTGSVAVLDIGKHTLTRIDGFRTAQREAHGRMRSLGPSSGTVGDGFAYVGNRASQEVCTIDLKSLHAGGCLKLPAPPDGVQYVASTHEVWVTAPDIRSLLVLQAHESGELTLQATIELPGEPEGYAVDAIHGRFLTNLEDANQTLSIDLKTHRVLTTWPAGCDASGPRGIAVDAENEIVLVACTDHVTTLDGRSGLGLAQLATGAGLDNIDYDPIRHLLYAASGKAARVTVASVGARGQLTLRAQRETAPGARNAIADANGTIYVADAQHARLLVLPPL